jgi:hypothetical protein
MTPRLRSSLSPRGEISTQVLIRDGLEQFDMQHLESIEARLIEADRRHQLNRLGKTTLSQVRSRLAKQRLASLFSNASHPAELSTQTAGG